MTTSDKIVIGSTIIMGTAAITMIMMSRKFDTLAEDIHSEMGDIRYTLSKSREDLIVLNKATAEGNRILRKIIKDTAEEFVDTPIQRTKPTAK